MGKMKNRPLRHEVVGDQFCGRAITGINHVASDFSFPYFLNIDKEGGTQLESYIRDIDAYGRNFSNAMFIILNFLLDSIYFHYKCLCENLHYEYLHCEISCFMAPLPALLRASVFKFLCNDTSKIANLMGIFPHISILYKMDSLLIKQGGLVSGVIKGIKKEIGEHNIGGGYNTTWLIF